MEPKKTPNSQCNPEKENQSRRHHNPELQAIIQSCNHQDSMVMAQKQTPKSMEQNRESRSGAISICSSTFESRKAGSFETNGKKTVSSTNGVGKTGQQFAEKWTWTPFLHHTQK